MVDKYLKIMVDREDRAMAGIIASMPRDISATDLHGQLLHLLPHMMNERQMRLSDPEGFRARISISIVSSSNLVPDLLCQSSDFDDFARRMAISNVMQFASPGLRTVTSLRLERPEL